MQLSPYTPGEVAREVPGREAQLQQIGGMLTLPALHGRFSGRIRVDVGPRGVGKTSLLRRVHEDASRLGLAPLYVTAGNGPLAAVIADEARALVSEWGVPSAASEWLDRLSVTLGVPGVAQFTAETSPEAPSPQATRAFRELIEKTSREALSQGLTGIAVLVDELQNADDEGLRTIAYAWQELQGSRTPAVFVAAGLSHTADVVTAAVTSAERFQFRTMRDLEDHEVREALSQPAADLGVRWETPALQEVVRRTQGYPYAVQLWGDAMWLAAGSPDREGIIGAENLDAAQASVDQDMSALHRARWSKASPREREVLSAMAHLGSIDVARADIADALGVTSGSLGTVRQSLLDKGIVQIAGHGRLSFTAPGFAEHVISLETR
ncbi:AAA family ATPase [Brachybacterium vulturis]|uniref:AAA family ATPase n=1 Tax=Brachybacterium vulturis TaxID=2017484 RepID=UPI0037365B42